ncbi:hypothetical protein GCM10010329_19030 [Streptomyces spiroverticillatus]|uniref:Uncharacterized protein n=1 Tax=Streptomyces finlayi TaxID=67296 RepID=A0A918WU28_9ACTN|nr:hypothetical protein GCM10010329_19030 [Streptomyces spiroverticillatus]GHC82884.1 hypothetical protein GCM10010334_11510 [Streptomyces finlayi]
MVEPDERADPMPPLCWTAKSTKSPAAGLARQGRRVGADTVGALLREEEETCQAPPLKATGCRRCSLRPRGPGRPGYGPQSLVGGGLRLDHLPVLRAGGINGFHMGGRGYVAGVGGCDSVGGRPRRHPGRLTPDGFETVMTPPARRAARPDLTQTCVRPELGGLIRATWWWGASSLPGHG